MRGGSGGASLAGGAGGLAGIAGASGAPSGVAGASATGAAGSDASAGAAPALGGAGAGGSAGTSGTAGSAPVAGASNGGAAGTAGTGGTDAHPLLALLPLFTAANVPVRGPMEAAPKLQLIDIKTNAIELEHDLPEGTNTGTNPHGEMRRMRKTAAGTYVVAFLVKTKVVEYDKDFILGTITTPQPWSVSRLHNGNTLILDENQSTCKEIDPQGNLTWSLKKTDFVVPGAQINGNPQTCERLASGNTVMFIHGTAGSLQAGEVTKDKNVVWALEDWKNLGDATAAQFLDEPGIPEVPGATEH